MTKIVTNGGRWKPGQSGNPKGRKPKGRALTEILKLKGEGLVSVGGEEISAQDALAEAVWQFVTRGEVWLSGKKLSAQNVTEWANVVKWLYTHIEPVSMSEPEMETELVVRVVREDKSTITEKENPHPLAPSPLRKEGD